MAPLKEPLTLHHRCRSFTNYLINKASSNLFLEFGVYETDECINAVHNLQHYLIACLPSTVFEELAQRRNSPNQINVSWLQDSRIKLSLYLHPTLTKFAVDPAGNELLQLNRSDGMDEFFWISHLRNLTNLTHLNLSMITTDDILSTVGKSCLKLVDINIVSKFRDDSSFRALVTDIGLGYITNCISLRSITMNHIIPTIYYDKDDRDGISLNGIRHMIKLLPDLDNLSFGSMGLILSDGFKLDNPLKIKYYCEIRPKFVDINRLEILCPYITQISLRSQIMNENYDLNENEKILQSLANSNLRLSKVELFEFPYGVPFKNFLKSKGDLLEEVLFRTKKPLLFDAVQYIGEHCPNLSKLSLKELIRESDNARSNLIRKNKYYTNLKSLNLSGKMWDPNLILPAFLSHAVGIKEINLLNVNNKKSIDCALEKIFKTNNLEELKEASFNSGCYISVMLLRKLVFDCPKLEHLSFLISDNINLEMKDVEDVRSDVISQNLNIKINCFEVH